MKIDQELLDDVADRLNSGATNYNVFLRLYQMPIGQAADSLGYIRELLGPNSVVGNIEEVRADVVCAEVEESLLFAGDEGAGPCGEILKSMELRTLIDEFDARLSELAGESKKIERFWLREGHPAYPVFWDFAFLFLGRDMVSMLIGSSSD